MGGTWVSGSSGSSSHSSQMRTQAIALSMNAFVSSSRLRDWHGVVEPAVPWPLLLLLLLLLLTWYVGFRTVAHAAQSPVVGS